MIRWFAIASVLVISTIVSPTNAATATRRIPNMPKGWTWPPSVSMKAAGATCLHDLEELGVVFEQAKRTKRINTPVVVRDLRFGGIVLVPMFRKPPFVMDCHLALGLARIAPKLSELGIVALHFSRIHSYRTIRRDGRPTKILSRHAIGLAMDVFEIEVGEGRRFRVKTAYPKSERVLLKTEVLINGSEDFRTLLTPRSDPRGHGDHFHFEAKLPIEAAN